MARAAALQSVAVRRLTGNDVVATISAIILARAAALQSVAVRRSTGNDVVATISAIIFFFISFHFFHFSPPSRPFLIEGVLRSKKGSHRRND